MTEGTRSYLIGCHQFLLHPLWVLLAWKLEYKSWPKWWEIICIFLHDVGICGRQYLSNDKAKKGHHILGAQLAYGILRVYFKFSIAQALAAYFFCAGHSSEFDFQSKLWKADKRSWLVAPLWWLQCNYWVEWHNKNLGVTLYDASIGWKKIVAENLRDKNPVGSHELYLRRERS